MNEINKVIALIEKNIRAEKKFIKDNQVNNIKLDDTLGFSDDDLSIVF